MKIDFVRFQDDEDDVAAETQVEQMRKIVVKTTRMNARVCTCEGDSAEDRSIFQSGRGNYVLKDAQIDISVEARENEQDRTGSIPKKKVEKKEKKQRKENERKQARTSRRRYFFF